MELKNLYLNSQLHKIISNDLSENMLNHCYMINGTDDFLVAKFAFFVAKEIFCLGEQRPCLFCNNCNKIEHGNMVDLIIYPRGEKSLVTEDINEIVNDCVVCPMESKYKVYILNNFHLCTVQAQNKILKTLEEPPQNVIFILTTNNESLILPTISSRSKKINLNLLSKNECVSLLKNLNVSNVEMLASLSGGNMSIALNLANNSTSLNIANLIIDTLTNLRSSSDIIKYSSQILSYKKDFNFFLDCMLSILRDVAIFNSGEINFECFSQEIENLSQVYSCEQIYKITNKINEIYSKLSFNCNLMAVVDNLLLCILEVKFLCQK